MSAAQIGALMGGLGLFLLGMRLMTDGLKLAAGASLRTTLEQWTRTRMRGLATGCFVTAVVQSSSAVTVAAIGFVNAGLFSLNQAVWVIYGSNIGTTMTGWLVSLVGLNLKIEVFALPLLGIGMVAWLFATRRPRIAALGEAVAGFGLFFLGISILKDAFSALSKTINIAGATDLGLLADLAFVGIGILTTILTQSSSAAVALALSATAGNLIPLEAAAGMVIGANLGTTSTALLAAIGATPNAKRVALSHVIFNLATAVVAVVLLRGLIEFVELIRSTAKLPEGPVSVLALFHTIFNLLGVLLMWPLSDRLVRWLQTRFVTEEENEARPRFLDRNVAVVPSLAIQGLLNELLRLRDIAAEALRLALSDERDAAARTTQRRSIADRLSLAIGEYTNLVYSERLSPSEVMSIEHSLRAVQHFSEVAEIATDLSGQAVARSRLPQSAETAITALQDKIRASLVDASALFPDGGEEELKAIEHDFKQSYRTAKAALLMAGTQGGISVSDLNAMIQTIEHMRDAAERFIKGSLRLTALRRSLNADAGPGPIAEPLQQEN